MSKITIETIQKELAVDNWKLLSTDYQNLKNELVFECNEGHMVFSSWEKIRSRRLCPVCEAFKVKNPVFENVAPTAKSKKHYRVLALDQATKNTGWAIFDAQSLVGCGIYEIKNSEKYDEFERFHLINEWLLSMIYNWKPDMIAIEGIQFQANMGVTTFQTLARLQGVLIETCLQQELRYKICPTNTWRSHCKVKGQTRLEKKNSMQQIIKESYGKTVKDDCADAIGIGKYVAETVHSDKVIMENWE